MLLSLQHSALLYIAAPNSLLLGLLLKTQIYFYVVKANFFQPSTILSMCGELSFYNQSQQVDLPIKYSLFPRNSAADSHGHQFNGIGIPDLGCGEEGNFI